MRENQNQNQNHRQAWRGKEASLSSPQPSTSSPPSSTPSLSSSSSSSPSGFSTPPPPPPPLHFNYTITSHAFISDLTTNSSVVPHQKDGILNHTHLANATTASHESGLDLVGERKIAAFDEASSVNLSKIEREKLCDVSNGRWVVDESYPLYASSSCPFIDEGFSCESNGRLDNNYMKWRWQPHQCSSIPRVNYYQEGNQVHPHLDVSDAFRKALTTWASWVNRFATPGKTRVFFRSLAPSHFRGGEWNSGGHCRESTQPLNDSNIRIIPEKNQILEEVVKQMTTPVTIWA